MGERPRSARHRKPRSKEDKRKLFPIRLVDFNTIREWEFFDADSGKDLGSRSASSSSQTSRNGRTTTLSRRLRQVAQGSQGGGVDRVETRLTPRLRLGRVAGTGRLALNVNLLRPHQRRPVRSVTGRYPARSEFSKQSTGSCRSGKHMRDLGRERACGLDARIGKEEIPGRWIIVDREFRPAQ